MTMADLCDRYLADAGAGRLLTRLRQTKKPSTLRTDRSRVEAHIRPLLGAMPVTTITREEVGRMMQSIIEGTTRKRTKLDRPHAVSNIRGGRGAASRTTGLLGAIMTYAVRLGLRTDNPVHGVMRPADGRRERRLRVEEYAALGDGLLAAEDDDEVWGPGLAAIRLMVLTGWRRGEVLGLRWSEVDLARRTANLADTKTGSSIRPLAEAVCTILREIPRTGEMVFPAPSGDVPMAGFRRVWVRIVHRIAGLPKDVTPHVLRHSYASLAADLGLADATIRALLGHRGQTITRRYIHSADAALLVAADAVAVRTVELMAGMVGPGHHQQASPTSPA
jgi:integrase